MKNVKRIMVSSMTVLSLSLLASTSMAKADENNDASQVQTKPVAQQQDTQKQNQVNTQEQTQKTTETKEQAQDSSQSQASTNEQSSAVSQDDTTQELEPNASQTQPQDTTKNQTLQTEHTNNENTTSSAETVNEADDKRADTKEIHNLNGEKYATIAHRGASGYAPEHTFPAYDKSHNEIGASYIEIDLQMTKDGKLVAMHDETVDRTTNGTGRVDSYTLKELKKLDAGSKFNEQNPDYADEAYKGAKVPTLDEIIERYGANANYYIETKSPDVYPGMEEKLLDTLDKHNLLTNDALNNGHVIVQSFSQDSIEKMNNLNPDVPLVRLLNKGELPNLSEQDLEYIKKFAIGVGPHYTDLTKENVKNLKELGFLVHPYTVNTKADMERLNSYGVDGVFTNYADIYKQVVEDSK